MRNITAKYGDSTDWKKCSRQAVPGTDWVKRVIQSYRGQKNYRVCYRQLKGVSSPSLV